LANLAVPRVIPRESRGDGEVVKERRRRCWRRVEYKEAGCVERGERRERERERERVGGADVTKDRRERFHSARRSKLLSSFLRGKASV